LIKTDGTLEVNNDGLHVGKLEGNNDGVYVGKRD
jgi:hypothetical protein